MTTGQFPKRRETDEQKKRRDEDAAVVAQNLAAKARPLHPVEVAVNRPRISSSGRLRPGVER